MTYHEFVLCGKFCFAFGRQGKAAICAIHGFKPSPAHAMKKACVRRLICVTGFGAGDSRAKLGPLQAMFFELLLGRAYEDKDAQETLVKRSGLDWIIVRPVILTNRPNTGRYKVLDHPKDWRSGTISRADVADFLLKQVQDSSYLGKTSVLTN